MDRRRARKRFRPELCQHTNLSTEGVIDSMGHAYTSATCLYCGLTWDAPEGVVCVTGEEVIRKANLAIR